MHGQPRSATMAISARLVVVGCSVVLGITVLRERLTARQLVGLVSAGAAVGLITMG